MSINTGKTCFPDRVPEYRIRVSGSEKLFIDRTFSSFQKIKKIIKKINKGVILEGKYYVTNTNNDNRKEVICW